MKQTVIFALLVLGCAWLTAISSEPILMLNTAMHSGAISKISVDAAGQLVLTSSYDKTARLWDLNSGELLHVLRPPLNETLESRGILYSCALSPDGSLAAVGGSTIDHNVYIFDTASGGLLRSIGPNPSNVLDLEFSPDGSLLAFSLARGGVRIFGCADWLEVANMEGYTNRVENVSFDLHGNLATVCYDGVLRLYDPEFYLVNERSFDGNPHLIDVAFSPDGSLIAIGGTANQLEVVSSADLQTLYYPDLTGAERTNNGFFLVAFSSDGKELYAGGYYMVRTANGWRKQIRVWQSAGEGVFNDYPVAANTFTDLKPLPGGGLVFSGSYPEWGRLTATGTVEPYNKADSYDFRTEDRSSLRVNQSGEDIGFKPYREPAFRLQIPLRSLTTEQSTAASYSDSIPGLAVTNWKYSSCIKLNGRDLECLKPLEIIYAVDTVPDPLKVVLGTNWKLYCLDDQGVMLWETQTLSTVCAVNVSGNGQVAVAEFTDGTLRWYRVSDGKLLLTFYTSSDGKRWILYTPSGFYDCAPGSESLIGWHQNQGEASEALFYPVARFRGTHYRPDVLDHILSALDEDEALRLANEAAGIAQTAKGVAGILPPSIKILSPAHNSGFTSTQVNVRYSVDSTSKEPLTAIKILLDGRPHKQLKDPKQLTPSGSIQLTLPTRGCRIGLIAVNKFGSSELAEVRLIWNGKATSAETSDKPNLYVLALGISDYLADILKLNYSAKDADDFSKTIELQDDLMYNAVNLRVLTNTQATRDNILDGLDWLQRSCQAEDVAMIFLSGHGANDQFGLFYYLPVGADVERLKATCVPFSDFQNTLSVIPGKVILFADACHSGGIYTEGSLRMPDLNRFINELSSAEVGVVIFTSSTTRQVSLESAEWQNGAFTKALIEGLNGSADFKGKGRISVKALDFYISDRVRELTNEKQTPTTIIPQSIPDFDIGLVP